MLWFLADNQWIYGNFRRSDIYGFHVIAVFRSDFMLMPISRFSMQSYDTNEKSIFGKLFNIFSIWFVLGKVCQLGWYAISLVKGLNEFRGWLTLISAFVWLDNYARLNLEFWKLIFFYLIWKNKQNFGLCLIFWNFFNFTPQMILKFWFGQTSLVLEAHLVIHIICGLKYSGCFNQLRFLKIF